MKKLLVAIFLCLGLITNARAAMLLPNGQQTFFLQSGAPANSGFVYMYVPGTTTPKTTWKDSAQTILNTNPIQLDASGSAVIYGSGSYRQVVYDNVGNLIFDRVTAVPETVVTTVSTIVGASTTYTTAQNNTIINRSNATAAMHDVLPGTALGVLPSGTTFTINNVDTSAIMSISVATGSSFKTAVASTGYIYLCPGQSVTFFSDGINYYAVDMVTRCVLTASSSIFLSPGGSATNDGLTAATPLVDPTFAYNLVKNNFDLAGNSITFSFATGTYGRILLQGPLMGAIASRTSTNVLFQGNPGTPANVVIADTAPASAAGVSAIFMFGEAIAQFNGFQITSVNGNDFSLAGGTAFVQNLDFHGVAAGQIHMLAISGNITVVGNYTISSSAGCHWIAGSMGTIETFITGGVGTITITLTGTPAWTSGFACVQNPSTIAMTTPLAFSGGAIGPRYNGSFNGTINTATGNVNFFPGNSAGTLSTGAQYN